MAAVDLAPVCRQALKVVCVSEDDRLTPATAADILAVNEAIATGCRGVARATQCPRGQRPKAVPQASGAPPGTTAGATS